MVVVWWFLTRERTEQSPAEEKEVSGRERPTTDTKEGKAPKE